MTTPARFRRRPSGPWLSVHPGNGRSHGPPVRPGHSWNSKKPLRAAASSRHVDGRARWWHRSKSPNPGSDQPSHTALISKEAFEQTQLRLAARGPQSAGRTGRGLPPGPNRALADQLGGHTNPHRPGRGLNPPGLAEHDRKLAQYRAALGRVCHIGRPISKSPSLGPTRRRCHPVLRFAGSHAARPAQDAGGRSA